jgi:hypothetical protein
VQDERSVDLIDAHTAWQRPTALCGLAFTVFLVLAWFLNAP